MTNCCDTSNPLIRDGISQRQRQITALSPDSVKVDEQDLADFLVFAYRLSQQIIYYKANPQPTDGQPDLTDNQADGNWKAFFGSSASVQLALISKTRPQKVREVYNQRLQIFLGDRTAANLGAVLQIWGQIFERIHAWYIDLATYLPFQSIICGLVKSNLREALLRLWAFERFYIQETGQAIIETTLIQGLNLYQRFNQTFNLKINLDVPPVADATPLNRTIFEARTELDRVFQILFQNYRQIIQQASGYITHSLESRQDHPPHLALYLAFWAVLQPARHDLNRMTQRHLDFFYRKVLGFPEKLIQPDRAHLIFELAKFQEEYKLNQNTALKAGKDARGVELIYKLNEDIVLHKAQVASLKGLFLASQTMDKGKQLTGLHASPNANSADGEEGEFPKDQVLKAWKPFGDDKRPQATVGLAIASDIFYLQESSCIIVLTLTFDKEPVGVRVSDLHTMFVVDFSGEKGWIVGSILGSKDSGPVTSKVELTVNLTADHDPIGGYHSGLPGAALSTDKPVARLRLNDQVKVNKLSPYNYFRDLKLTNLTIKVDVDTIRNLIVQNDVSVLDPSKPFQPFGFRPAEESTFYVGSKEIFQKELTSLLLKITWEGLPGNLAAHYRGYYVDEDPNSPDFTRFLASVARLTQNTWSSKGLAETYNLFSLENSEELVKQLPLPGETINSVTGYNLQTRNGFLRFSLRQSFLHDEFVSKYALQVLASAKNFKKQQYVNGAVYEIIDDKGNSTLKRWKPSDTLSGNIAPIPLNEPYTPVIRSITFSYGAIANQKDYQLFHLYPFDGFSEIASLPNPLFPTFVDEGTLYIGIQDLNPPTALPLLIQVAEETADTDLLKATVQWSYLSNNTWQPFQQHQIVSDGTNGLITSGIVRLAIPAEITLGNTILDPAFYWLKVAVAERSRAVCQMIGIYTQSALAIFSDQGNDPAHLTKPLPAGAIAKLVDPQPEVKKIEQPYPSFGGQGKEVPANYYVRVSEHLRHKGRAVTIFDYERLVLERFPEIYKVRCINHAHINDTISDPTRDNLQELVPGSVTLAVIPDLSHRPTTNDLEPKVNVSLLEDIRKYLVDFSSPWVDIRVVNPRYEAIQAEFWVEFKSPYKDNFGYYQRELQREIIGFLSPWTANSGAEIHFGGKVYRSSILNFVEKQPYVDYVLNFQMHRGDELNLREVVASSARSILVSVPFFENPTHSQGHLIKAVETCAANRPIASDRLGYQALDQLMLEESPHVYPQT